MTEADLSEESDVAGWREECGSASALPRGPSVTVSTRSMPSSRASTTCCLSQAWR